MPNILHIIDHLDQSDASRAAIASASCSSTLGDFSHRFVALKAASPDALQRAEQAGIAVHVAPAQHTLSRCIEEADIVHVE
jgi:hypothetical protein